MPGNLTTSTDVDNMLAAADNAAVRTSIGLGSAAVANTSAFDASGAAATVQGNLTALASSLADIATSGSADDLIAGTLPDATFPAMLPAVDGSQLTNLPAGAPALLVYGAASAVGVMPATAGLDGTELLYLAQLSSDKQLSLADLFGGTFPVALGFSLISAANIAAAQLVIGVDKSIQFGSTATGGVGALPPATTPLDGTEQFYCIDNTSADAKILLSDIRIPSLQLQVVDSTILSALPPATTLLGDELVYTLQGGINDSKVSVTALLSGCVVVVSDTDYVDLGNEKHIWYDTITANRTVTLLPASLVGREIRITDIVGSAATHNIIVDAGAGTIAGPGVAPTSTYSITTNRGYVVLVSDGTGNFYINGAA